MDSQVPKLSLALGLGPPVLFLLQQLGHLQVMLSQATLVDVGRQVALNCGHKHTTQFNNTPRITTKNYGLF